MIAEAGAEIDLSRRLSIATDRWGADVLDFGPLWPFAAPYDFRCPIGVPVLVESP